MMNQAEEAKLLEQLEQWNKKDEYSRCIRAIEAIPEQERGYLLTVKLSRAYSNLAVLGDHGEHGTDSVAKSLSNPHAIFTTRSGAKYLHFPFLRALGKMASPLSVSSFL